MVRTLIPEERRGRAFGGIEAGAAVAAGLGPPLGGLVTDTLGWRWIFVANVLLLAPALLLALRLPADRPSTRAVRFDLAGAALLTGGLVSIVLALTVWRLPGIPAPAAPVLALLGAACGTLLVCHAGRHPAPALNLALFRRPGFTPATLTVLLSNLSMYTILLSLPVFLSGAARWSSGRVGLLLAALSLQMSVVSPAGGWLSDRGGRRLPALLGTALTVAGVAPLVAVASSWGWALYVGPLALMGIGLYAFMVAVAW